jgi:predicted ribosome-associated RNA-binding protein Tma20
MRLNIKIKLSLLLTILIVQLSNSQILYNNGAQIIVQTGADVMVQGSVENNTGTITNDGFINITQDITNQSILQGNGIYSV